MSDDDKPLVAEGYEMPAWQAVGCAVGVVIATVVSAIAVIKFVF